MPKRVKLPRDLLAGWTIVLVDDEEDSLDVARRILTHFGATVHTGSDGAQGVALTRQHMPRFVISDLSMPGVDGWALIFELKEDDQTKNIPVIALTAHAMAGDEDRALDAGFHSYLTKPLSPATFMSDLLERLKAIPDLAAALTPVPGSNGAHASPTKPKSED